MPLPIINQQTFEVQLLSIDAPVTFRPYTVKEEKVFLLALESKDEKEMSKALQNVLSTCVLDDIDIRNLPSFDLEKLFLATRCRSVSQVSEFILTFDQCAEEKKCTQEISLDLTLVDVVTPENHSKKLMITDKVGIVMRYPTIKLLDKLKTAKGQIDLIIEIIGKCIESFIDGKKTIPADSVKSEEILTFVESLTRSQFESIIKFFETMPKLQTKIVQVCPKCGIEQKTTIEGLENFFT